MATVFIWNNHRVHTGHTWDGHASMSIDDVWPADFNTTSESFVSWAFGGEVYGKSSSGHQRAFPNLNIWADLSLETYAPDHVIRLHFKQERLNEMKECWEQAKGKNLTRFRDLEELAAFMGYSAEEIAEDEDLESFKANPSIEVLMVRGVGGPSYRRFRKSCSTMVARVLKVSGRGSIFRRHHLVWTPLDVKRLAQSMDGESMTWDSFVTEAAHALQVSNWERAVEFLRRFQRRDAAHGSSKADVSFEDGRRLGRNNTRELRKLLGDREIQAHRGAWDDDD